MKGKFGKFMALNLGRREFLVTASVLPLSGFTWSMDWLERWLAPAAILDPFWAAQIDAARQPEPEPDYGPWQDFIDRYLSRHDDGLNQVAYDRVSTAARAELAGFVTAMAAVRPRQLAPSAQRAFWINLYNVLMVGLVLDHPGIETVWKIPADRTFDYGPWNNIVISIEGRGLSLNHIEHRILRPIFRDPRLHYALNCASSGCPNLQAKAFRSDSIEQQLDAGARAYINHPRGLNVAEDGGLVLSKIYLWFRADFQVDGGVLAHLRKYAEGGGGRALANNAGINGYVYDWSLNRAKKA